MVVFGTLKTEEIGQILHSGSLEDCKRFLLDLKKKDDYSSLNINQDNGIIEHRAILNNMPTKWLLDLIEKSITER